MSIFSDAARRFFLHLFLWKVELIQPILDNLSVLQLDVIAAGQCLNFSVCLFVLNFIFDLFFIHSERFFLYLVN